VKPDLQKGIDFKQMNLMSPWTAMPRMDIVFLRNVLIYFDADTKRDILNRMRTVMAPDGFLFLGAAETTLQYEGLFERVPRARGNCYRVKPT
jgi:chemotaxis protein methyltransferase CheR